MMDLNILITNDDGIHAQGLYHLKRSLEKIAAVWVVAPDTEKSAVGHAITLSDPLRVFSVEKDRAFFGYAVNGTPADCVKLAINCLMDKKPDIVISGINLGANTATNIIYSGTVSAAAEAVMKGVPAIAVSLTTFHILEFEYSCSLVIQLVKKIMKFGLPQGTLLNVNVPPLKADKIEGIVITRQGKGRFEEIFDKRVDPINRTYYWYSGKNMILDNEDDVDDVVILQNKVSITPLKYDLTNMNMIEELKKWEIKK
jgi:5'-nucleotidase